jgi:hypothetical protein
MHPRRAERQRAPDGHAARVQRVSVFIDSATDGDPVEGLALCRLEPERSAALVNVAWGRRTRLTVRRDDGTPPWAPFERFTVVGSSRGDLRPPTGGTRRDLDNPRGHRVRRRGLFGLAQLGGGSAIRVFGVAAPFR